MKSDKEKIYPCTIKNCKVCGTTVNAFSDVVCPECGRLINGESGY